MAVISDDLNFKKMDKLPEKLFEVKCEVIVKYEDCALVLTKVRYFLSSCKEF